jgi:hypothetical protein
MCQRCGHQCTVTAGTIFDKTRTPFRVRLAAGWYLTNQKQGVSALGLQRVLGLGSYQTAWTLLHRYRHAIVRSGRDALHGLVEVDETYLAITDRERPAPKGKSHTRKVLVALAVEILEPRGFGRIRLQRLPNDTESALVPFVQESIAPAGARAHRRFRRVPLARPIGLPAHASGAPRRLPRRVRVPLQPAHLRIARAAVLSRVAAGTRHWPAD